MRVILFAVAVALCLSVVSAHTVAPEEPVASDETPSNPLVSRWMHKIAQLKTASAALENNVETHAIAEKNRIKLKIAELEGRAKIMLQSDPKGEMRRAFEESLEQERLARDTQELSSETHIESKLERAKAWLQWLHAKKDAGVALAETTFAEVPAEVAAVAGEKKLLAEQYLEKLKAKAAEQGENVSAKLKAAIAEAEVEAKFAKQYLIKNGPEKSEHLFGKHTIQDGKLKVLGTLEHAQQRVNKLEYRRQLNDVMNAHRVTVGETIDLEAPVNARPVFKQSPSDRVPSDALLSEPMHDSETEAPSPLDKLMWSRKSAFGRNHHLRGGEHNAADFVPPHMQDRLAALRGARNAQNPQNAEGAPAGPQSRPILPHQMRHQSQEGRRHQSQFEEMARAMKLKRRNAEHSK